MRIASDRKIKRSVALSPAADAVVLAAQQPGESYSQTLDRVRSDSGTPA